MSAFSRSRSHRGRDRSPSPTPSNWSTSSSRRDRDRDRHDVGGRSRSPSRFYRRSSPSRTLSSWEDEEFSRRHALRTLVCSLCHVTSEDEATMERHLTGKPHLMELQRMRERACKKRAEEGKSLKVPDSSDSRVLPKLGERQEEWQKRYDGGKLMKSELQVIQSLDPRPTTVKHDPDRYDNGQFAFRKDTFYCDLCDVWVGARNIMESHLSGKEHKRRMKPPQRFYCHICNVDVSSEETLKAHQKGVSHIRTAALEEQTRQRRRQESSGLGRDISDNELEELHELRERVQKQQNTILNLQTEVQKLLKLKSHCELNHSTIKEESIVA